MYNGTTLSHFSQQKTSRLGDAGGPTCQETDGVKEFGLEDGVDLDEGRKSSVSPM